MKKKIMILIYSQFILIMFSCGGDKSPNASKNSDEKVSEESLTDAFMKSDVLSSDEKVSEESLTDAFMKSASLGDLSKVKSLVEESGVDPKLKDNFDRSALHYAAFFGHLDVMKYLIEKGSDINVQDKEKHKVLYYVAMSWKIRPWDRHPDVLTYFIKEMEEECKSKDLRRFQNDLDKFVDNFLICSLDTEIDIVQEFFGKNSRVSFEQIQTGAEKGEAIFQFILGLLYSKGQGISQDHKKSFEWYEKAAKQGYAKAQVILGIMYEEGRGVPQDNEKALEWYEEADKQGYAKAKDALKKLQDKNKK